MAHELTVRNKGDGVRDIVCSCGGTSVGFTGYTPATYDPATGSITEGDYISLDAATDIMMEGMKARHPEAS
jgi:hypothetical protein